MPVDPSGTLEKEVNGGKRSEHGIKVHVKRLLHHLCGYQNCLCRSEVFSFPNRRIHSRSISSRCLVGKRAWKKEQGSLKSSRLDGGIYLLCSVDRIHQYAEAPSIRYPIHRCPGNGCAVVEDRHSVLHRVSSVLPRIGFFTPYTATHAETHVMDGYA